MSYMPPLGANEQDRTDIRQASRALLVFTSLAVLFLLGVIVLLLLLEKPEWMSGFDAWRLEVGGAAFGLLAFARQVWGDVVKRVNTRNRLVEPGAIPAWVRGVERGWDVGGILGGLAAVGALVMEYLLASV